MSKELGDAWKDYCTLMIIAKSLLKLNKYCPLPVPSACGGNVESPDEDMGSDSDSTTELGLSLKCNLALGKPLHLCDATPPKMKQGAEKRHKCPYSG